ncbi:MAG TPA: histidine phosphatase family protein, partial [Steroidobacteraceae bacterium]
PLTRIIVSPYTRALQTAQPILDWHQVPVTIMHEVREQAAFTCDIGSAPTVLASRFPHHDFEHLPAKWWHEGTETSAQTRERANGFRVLMAAREDKDTTLLVSHWAFLLALCGIELANGEILEYDPLA